MEDMSDLLKTSHIFYHAEFSSTSKDVDINRREPQNWAVLGLRPLGIGGVADGKKQAHPTWSFCVKGCRHKWRRTPKVGERSATPLRLGRGWSPRNTPLPHACYPAEFGHSSGSSGIKGDPPGEIATRFPHFKVTQNNRNRPGMISDLWLPIYVP